jgi:ketosteroid isomerase-like protein
VTEKNKDVARRFVEAMGANDPETAAGCLAADAFAVARGYSHFAGKRDAKMMIGGIEAFKQLMPTGLAFKIISVTGEGERVVVEAEGNAVTSEGTPYRNHYCFVVELHNGKIKQFREYFCGVHANEVLWPLAKKVSELANTAG